MRSGCIVEPRFHHRHRGSARTLRGYQFRSPVHRDRRFRFLGRLHLSATSQFVTGTARCPHLRPCRFHPRRRGVVVPWWTLSDWWRMRRTRRQIHGFGVMRYYRSGARRSLIPRVRNCLAVNGTIARRVLHTQIHVLCLEQKWRGRSSGGTWLVDMRRAFGEGSC